MLMCFENEEQVIEAWKLLEPLHKDPNIIPPDALIKSKKSTCVVAMHGWIHDYHKATWMGSTNHFGFNGKYKIKQWLIYRLPLRTNNLSEINNFIMALMMGRHPLWWTWYHCLQVLDALAHIRWGQLKRWDRPRKQKESEFIKTETLKQLWDKLDERTIQPLMFLELCSKTYKLYFDSVDRILNELEEQEMVEFLMELEEEETKEDMP